MRATHALIVDDSSTIRTILTSQLESLGFECVGAATGEEALSVLRQGYLPTLIVADWNMPIMSGLELVAAIRSEASHNDAKILMVTSQSSLDQIAAALDAGADEYLFKPFDEDMLRQKLEIMGLLPLTI
jgi:two-component system chemotaxis response regulator CheY